MNSVIELDRNSHIPGTLRSRDELARVFEVFEMRRPGVVFVSQWRPEGGCGAEIAQNAACRPEVTRKP